MTEAQVKPPRKFIKDLKEGHLEAVEEYMRKGASKRLARDIVAKDIRLDRLHVDNDRLRMNKREAVYKSLTDALTGLPNKRYLEEAQERMFAEASRMGHGLTALFIDGDDFKAVNENHGHQIGDMVIRQIAQVIKTTLREADFLARFGGEEFVALLPENNSLTKDDLQGLYKRLNDAVESTEFPEGIRQTISIGAASFSKEELVAGPRQLIARASDAERQAKLLGKNRFVVWDKTIPAVLGRSGT